jgi:membrane-bound metal-dependent hydrolase YbcI (DUF457 family)
MGAMVPDLEIPVIVSVFGLNGFPRNRLVLHSLFGAMTMGTLLSVRLVVFIIKPILLRLLSSCRSRIRVVCRASWRLAAACCLGALSHVLLDVVTHPLNPVWWPFSTTLLVNPYGAVGGPLVRGMHIGLLIMGVALLWHHRRQLPNAILGPGECICFRVCVFCLYYTRAGI